MRIEKSTRHYGLSGYISSKFQMLMNVRTVHTWEPIQVMIGVTKEHAAILMDHGNVSVKKT